MKEQYFEIFESRKEKLNTIHLSEIYELVTDFPYAFISQQEDTSKIEEKIMLMCSAVPKNRT